MSFDAGSARSTYIIDYSQAEQAAQRIKQIWAGIAQSQAQASKGAGGGSAGGSGSSNAQAQANDALRLAQAQARVALASRDTAGAINILQTAYGNSAGASERLRLGVQAQAIQLQQSTTFADQFGASLKSNLLGIIGPAALAGAAIAAIKGAIDFTEESYKLKAALDTTNLSIGVQLKSFRDVNKTLADGATFAAKYNLTQAENAEAIQASIPLLRQSKAALSDVEATLLRLSVLKPEQGISGAAFALAELQGGQARSLATRFNIPIAKATELKNEIKNGGDAVQVVGKYLDSVGVGMDTLAIRTQGATGKMNELRVETEKFQLALGGQSGGVGAAILNARIDLTKRGTDFLSGNTAKVQADDMALLARQLGFSAGEADRAGAAFSRFFSQLTGGTVVTGQRTQATLRSADADDRAAASSAGLGGALNKELSDKVQSTLASAELAQQQKQVDIDSQRAAQGLLGAGDQALLLAKKYGIATGEAQGLIDAQNRILNPKALADQRLGERSGGEFNDAEAFNKFRNLQHQGDVERAADAKREAEKRAAENKRLADSENALALSRAKNSAQRIAVLQKELSQTTDQADRNRILAQIEGEKNSQTKATNTTLSKQLGLNESIYDSQNKQINAQIDLNKLTAEGVIKTLDENKKIRTANAILANANASDEQKQRAQATLDIIAADRAERAQKARELSASAGGSIVKGRLLQSVPGSGGATPTALPTIPSAGAAAGGATAPAGDNAIVLRLVDSGGRVIAETVEPFIMESLLRGVRSVAVTK